MKSKDRLRREEDILDRLENVKRLIQMRTTLETAFGCDSWRFYQQKGHDEVGNSNLLGEVGEEIELQLLSIVALCWGDNPDLGDPMPMLIYKNGMKDKFFDAWTECLEWFA